MTHPAHGAACDRMAVLIGTKPAEGYLTLARLGVPFIWIVDPADGPVPDPQAAAAVVRAPFKTDPLSVLQHTFPPQVSGVFSFTEMGSLPAALLAESLGVPTVPVRAVLRARDKHLMRRLTAAEPTTPAFGIVGREEPDSSVFPVVLKPADGTGSQGVEYVPDRPAYRRLSPERTGALWEQYVDGAEYSVEAVSADGEHRILGITAKRTTGKPYFVETRHEVPARVTPDVEREIRACVGRTLDLLEVTTGASHTEVKLDGGRPVLIETHTRAGGDRIPLLTKLVSGVDQIELAVRSVLPWVEVRTTEPAAAYAAVHYFPWQAATLVGVDGLEKSREIDGVVEVEVPLAEGGDIPVWRYSHERPGHVVVAGSDPEDLDRVIAEVEATLNPRLRR
ncbi:ATP-grasp domain-containing protein [Streptomyces tendae]|uniref:ATP-grasp domain-containing protein n=1 Tax=Streptomyces tendae TaxID=1932 RepID=UPI003716DAAC